jgi:hypothetical protein
MHVIDYCNYPLNNNNIDYHCLVVFHVLGFHVNHCVHCVISILGLFFSINLAMFMILIPNKWYQRA